MSCILYKFLHKHPYDIISSVHYKNSASVPAMHSSRHHFSQPRDEPGYSADDGHHNGHQPDQSLLLSHTQGGE